MPWPQKDNAILYKPALPERYRKIAVPLGIVGAIEIEASRWLEDNQWVLDIAAKDKLIVGTVGDLDIGTPDFRKNFDRFHKNPIFRGLRHGNLWERQKPGGKRQDDLGADIGNKAFVDDLKVLADAGLELDSANPNPALVRAILKTSDVVPNLRIVMDHLPQLVPPSADSARKGYYADLHELGKRPQIFVKISSVLRRTPDGKVPEELSFYKERLDELWSIFGNDRVIYGSDWPNSDLWAAYPHIFKIVHDYVSTKPREVQEKYFWKNSVAAYKWVKRTANQPG